MKNNLRKSTVAAAIAFAFTLIASISFSAHATTLTDLTAVLTTDQTQTGFDIAIRAGEFKTAYEAAMLGTANAFTQSAAVILQSGGSAAADGNFAFIEQIATTGITDFNYASIEQTSANNNAYILQTDGQNYASIVQSGAVSTVAYISQAGFGNRAIINQK